ncbi:hypothetical protein glysoja_025266 [Glycine soja]|uniref:Uncharacterized protein n=1 Tax=Glycine soja TaxID=3848 RepID=A0A0B2QWC4_GLYSO|nr:hypothetical protein glysoja_025266 [Glycine soja]
MIFLRFIIGVDNQIFTWRSGSSTRITKIRKVSQFFFVSLPSRDPWEATATKGKRVKRVWGVASKGGKGGVGFHGGTRWWGWVAWRKVRGGGAQEKG